jgi:serine/threonine-protein kinase
MRRLDGNRGRMAQVYLAARTAQPDAAPVVVKIANVYDQYGQLHPDALRREADYLAELCHPTIVRLLPASDAATSAGSYVGETQADGYAYLVLEHLAGGSLSELLQRRGRALSGGEAVVIAYALAMALDYVHAHGLVHMDIAPHNILLRTPPDETRLPDAALIDFGSACRIGRQTFTLHETFYDSTYLAPEVLAAANDGVIDVRPKIDIYALGAVLYTMLAGEPPFVDKDPRALQAAILRGAYRPLAERWKSERSAIPPALQQRLDELVRAAMHTDPARRCDAAFMARQLCAIGFHLGIWPAAQTRAGGERNGGVQRSLLAALVALGVLLFGAGVGAGFLAGGLPSIPTVTPAPTTAPTVRLTATSTSTPIPTPTSAPTPTALPTSTLAPTASATAASTPTATSAPTATVRAPTATPAATTPP